MSSKQGGGTIFQQISGYFNNGGKSGGSSVTPYEGMGVKTNPELYRTTSQEDYKKELDVLRQQNFLSMQWKKASADNTLTNLPNLTNIKLMYRDADLMDGWPEIGSALDVVSEEACVLGRNGKIINVKSKSERIKAILEDLFDNRLDSKVLLPMICRATTKYGNNYMLLNTDRTRGVLGWKQLPVYEIDRVENGLGSVYMSQTASANVQNINPDSTQFVWTGKNEATPYQNWQVAHFRLLTDSIYLPYGVSFLHKARRHWRMLSMMEDMMLIYRLERSVERRIFKIYVGAIDPQDVQAYVQQIANDFKRTQVIDPLTGQIDLRKNFLDSTSDYFIPVRDEGAPTPIETLPAAQNITSMEDIEYMQNKVLSALRVPKTFLNFQETQGKGQNLSLLDIRFSRMINRVQQTLLMELNKVALIHLYLLGFTDELTNFTLTMNNPSSQIEMMEIENLQKKLQVAQMATGSDGGIPIMSWRRTLKEIMGFTDTEITDILNEIRLERGIIAELDKTDQIIKKTGIFDPVDRIYGEIGASYTDDSVEDDGGGSTIGGVGGGFGADFGASVDEIGEPGGDNEPIEGQDGTVNLGELSDDVIPMEQKTKNSGKLLNENTTNKAYDNYLKLINQGTLDEVNRFEGRTKLYDKTFTINEEFNAAINKLAALKTESSDLKIN